jgi:hypothetical protein
MNIAFIQYSQAPREAIKNHLTIEGVADGIVERIRTTYGSEPTSVTIYKRLGILLDTGGMVMLDQPKLRCRLKGYSVYYKLEHAHHLAYIVERCVNNLERRRVYDGRECVSIYTDRVVVLPLEDAMTVLRHLKRNATRGFVKHDQKLAELAASPHVYIPGKSPLEVD